MDFLGKWTLKAGDGTFVTLQKSTGQLDVSGKTAGEDQKFNAYGTTNQFMLQAANGQYIAASGTGYKADQKRTGQVTYFKIETTFNGVRILDLGIKGAGSNQFYWNDVSGALQRLKKAASPPTSTEFSQTVVTVSLQDILNNNFPAGPTDLSWAYLANVDFSNVLGFFTTANLQNATLTKANLSVDLSSANLSNAQMQYISITGMSSDLSGAIVNGADLTHANLNNATITAKTQFVKTTLIQVNLKEATVEDANFTGATLTSSDFTGATVSGCNFTDANLTDVKLSNASLTQPFIDLSKVTGTQFSAKTNFTNAELRFNLLQDFDFSGVNMSGADLTGCKMDNTILASAELSFANLTNVTLTGNINMHAANFSNATLTGADMTGAQLGGISLQFFVPKGKADFTKLLKGLEQDDVKAVTAVFCANKIALKGSVIINTSQYAPGRVWTVERTQPTQKTFTVRLETIQKSQSLRVYQSATTAILTNAFMKGTVLTSANLYNVRASGVQLYGDAKLDGNAILEGVQFDSANLASINLTQARMYGINLDYANLVNANLQGAQLTTSANGGQATLNSTQLQGTDFTDSQLDGAIFTDAAVSVSVATTPISANGIWLFDTSVSNANLYIPELQAASPVSQLNQFPNEVETLLPHLQPGKISPQLIAAYAALTPKITIDANSLLMTIKSDSYWKITDGSNQYVIFHACDADQHNNIPALGVAKGSTFTTQPLFTIPLSLERNLTNGKVNNALIAAFKKQKITLTSSATIAVAHQPTDFQIVQPNGTTYTLWFGLQASSASCGYELFTRPSISNIISLFAEHSLPLSTRTTVINHGATLWNVINDDENPFNPVTNYVEFFVRKNVDGTLSIFGSFLRVRRLSAANQEQYYNFPCALTTLTDAQLQPTTVCPNSLRKSVNINNQLPFEQWMRAKSLPKAPFCIPDPDGMFSCPQ